MSKEINQIDKFYSEALGSNTQEASAYTWTRLRWRLFWLNYNGYIFGISAAVILALAVILGPDIFEGNRDNFTTSEQLIQNSGSVDPNTNMTLVLQENDANENIAGLINESKSESEKTTENVFETPVVNTIQTEENKPLYAPNTREDVGDDFFTEEISEQELVQFSKIQSLGFDGEISEKDELVVFATQFETFKTPYDVELKKNWVSVGLWVAPAYTITSLKAADGYEDYLQYRKDHESPAISVSTGLDVRFNIRKWHIQTGLGYSEYKQYRNYNNSFKALDSLSSYYQTDTIWGWIYDPPNVGEPIVLGYDTTFIPVYNTTNEGYNRWSYIEVPLIAGYKFKTGRFSLDVGTGISCAFLINAEGNVPHLDEDNRFNNLSDLNDEMNKYLFNYILQVGASYHLTPQWSINFSPFYKQNLNSVFNKNYPIDQKFRSIGINFGLKVDL